MEIFWTTLVLCVAATSAIAAVIRAIRLQEEELKLFEPFDLVHGSIERSK